MIFFVSEKFLIQNGMITKNSDVNDFAPLIQSAAKAFIKPMIGSYFFDDLLTKYNNETLSADEMKVVDIMRYSIAWRATADAGVALTYQLKNKGYQKQNGDNSESVDDQVVWKMYDHYIQKCFIYDGELKKYLTENKDLYPNFTSNNNRDSSILNNCNGGDSGFQEGVGILVL